MLNITDRAVSKWERGRSLPDVSIMQQLCSLLGISVNELLNGERIDMNEFNERTEQLLMEMVKKEEISNKRFLMYETVIGLFSTVILLSSIVVASFVQMQMYFRISLIAFGCAIFLTGIIFALKIETDAGYYECRHCGNRYIPKFRSVFFAMHYGRSRYLKCPKCHKHSWNKKVISKE